MLKKCVLTNDISQTTKLLVDVDNVSPLSHPYPQPSGKFLLLRKIFSFFNHNLLFISFFFFFPGWSYTRSSQSISYQLVRKSSYKALSLLISRYSAWIFFSSPLSQLQANLSHLILPSVLQSFTIWSLWFYFPCCLFFIQKSGWSILNINHIMPFPCPKHKQCFHITN